MKQDYTMAYLRFLAGRRTSCPNPGAYRRVLPNRRTVPLTAAQGRIIRLKVDTLLKEIVERRALSS